MRLFFRRPLALFCALFTAALICGCFLLQEHCRIAWIGAGVVGTVLLIAILFIPKKRKAGVLSCALCLLFVACALITCDLRILAPQQELAAFAGTESRVTLSVLEVRYEYSYATSYLVQVDRLGKERPKTKALLTYEYNPELTVGDVLYGTARVEGIEAYADHTNTYIADGITLSLTPTEHELVVIGHEEIKDPLFSLRRLNRALSARLTVGIGSREGALISSLLLGNRELLAGQVLRDFRRAGIVHMLAISGMHLSLMVVLTEFLLRKCYVPKNVRCLLILFVALFYLALTGLSLSTVRAFIMTAFVYAAYLFHGDNDPITSLFFALFLILCLLPHSVYDAGMWLSFSATLGILIAAELLRPVTKWLYGHIKNKRLCRWINAALTAISVSLAASFSVFLPAWIFFDEISLLSVPATILLSPLVTLILYLAPCFLAFMGIAPVATLLGNVLRDVCRLLLAGAAFFAELPDLTVSLQYPFEEILIPSASLLVAILVLIPLRKKSLLPLCALGVTLAFFICLGVQRHGTRDELQTSYLRHNDSEMLLIVIGEDATICDISSGSYSSIYDAYLLSKELFSTQIEAFVLTHYHTRHTVSLRQLSAETLVRELFLPYPQTEEEYYLMLSLLDLCEQCGISATVYDRGKRVPLDTDVTLFISEEIYLKRSTHPTGYVAVEAYGDLFLYLGESVHESSLLRPQLDSLITKADTVVLGVHGPITKTNFPYSFENTPTLAIASEELLPYLKPTAMPNGNWVVGCEQFSFKHKK